MCGVIFASIGVLSSLVQLLDENREKRRLLLEESGGYSKALSIKFFLSNQEELRAAPPAWLQAIFSSVGCLAFGWLVYMSIIFLNPATRMCSEELWLLGYVFTVVILSSVGLLLFCICCSVSFAMIRMSESHSTD